MSQHDDPSMHDTPSPTEVSGGIVIPPDGRPIVAPGADQLIGVDGNVFSVIGATQKMLRRAGASAAFIGAYQNEAMSGTYDHAIATSMAYLDAE